MSVQLVTGFGLSTLFILKVWKFKVSKVSKNFFGISALELGYLRSTMQTQLSSAIHFDIQTLAQAVGACDASDALQCQFSVPHWTTLGSFMHPFPMIKGQILIEQGARDRTLYFVESGHLSAHSEDEHANIHMALVGAGTVLGEGAFFTSRPRVATVYASSPCKMWCLTQNRFAELSRHHSPIALELTLAIGCVMAKRLSTLPKRAAVT